MDSLWGDTRGTPGGITGVQYNAIQVCLACRHKVSPITGPENLSAGSNIEIAARTQFS